MRISARLILLTMATAAGAVASPAEAGAVGDAPSRPNVVVVMTDDQTMRDMRALPRVRRLLGRRGTTFSRYYATYPLCCPSRASFLTGQYPHNHGVLWNFWPEGGYYAFGGQDNTLPVWLQRAGYHTALVGKYLNEYGERDPREIPPGWDDWVGAVDPTTYSYFGYTLNENGRLRRYGFSPRDYQTDVLTRHAVRLIERRAPGRRPFFLWVTPTAPHTVTDTGRAEGTPAVPAPRHARSFADARLPRPPSFDEADMSDKPSLLRPLPRLSSEGIATLTAHHRGRLGSLLAVDEGVARMVRALRRVGELDDTVLVFTSDNGWLLGEHRVPGQKYLGFEEAIHVPLIVRGPGFPAGREIDDLSANIDLAPTIVDLAGARAGRRQDGASLRRLVGGRRERPRRDLLIETGPNPRVPHYAQIHTRRYVYEEISNGETELYDLARDPYELENRAAERSYAGVRADLARRLDALRTCAGRGCYRGDGR
jgi:N-acetylglucosamine-6-sulfatase